MNCFQSITRAVLVTAALCGGSTTMAWGQEAKIRKNFSERLANFPVIKEVRSSPINGLFEVRTEANDIFYADAEGNYFIEGEMIDTRNMRNLTAERRDALNSVEFDKLPLKDAFNIVQGNGQRKLAVFADPNCGYCKRFERELKKFNDVTIHVFLYPVLGPDSVEKAKNIWCAKDRAKSWQDWMLHGQVPAAASCDHAAIERNTEFGRKYRITGTPTSFTGAGTRLNGAMTLPQLEKHF